MKSVLFSILALAATFVCLNSQSSKTFRK